MAALGIGYSIPKSNKVAKIQTNESHEEKAEEGHAKPNEVLISENDAKAAGIELGKINFGTGSELRILGRVTASPEAKIMVGTPISGRVSRVYVAIGSKVNKGAPLFEIISSDGAGLVADAKAAGANVAAASAHANAAQSAYSSDEWLFKQGVISKRELENSRALALASSANVQSTGAYANAAKAKIAASGNPSSNGALVIRAPISGIIGNMPISVGGFVPQGAMAGEITNVENTEAVFQVAPNAVEKLSIGSKINIETNDGKQYIATIKAIAPASENGTGASIMRAKIDGESLALGTVLSARIVTNSGSQNLKPIVPNDAIINIGDGQVVFVKSQTGFIAVNVLVGNNFNGHSEIISGLKGDEIIVTKNAFLLKSQLAKSEVEEEH